MIYVARTATVGVYRFWRDLGFAVGAVVVGLFADASGLDAAMLLTAALTFSSGVIVWVVLRETRARGPTAAHVPGSIR